MLTQEQKKLLEEKLNPSHVKKPDGKFGPKGDYLEGWHVINEANRIFGFDGWSYQIINLSMCAEPYQNEKGNSIVSYICTLSVTVLGVTRQDVGYGSGASKQIGDAHESASKEAVTDALKRALRTFGNQFGLALYDKKRTNVDTAENVSKANAREPYEALKNQLEGLPSREAIERWYKDESTKELRAKLPSDWHKTFAREVGEAIKELEAKTEAA